MSKLSAYALTLALLSHGAFRRGGAVDAACTPSSVVSSFVGECTYSAFAQSLSPDCTTSELFPGKDQTEIEALVSAMCEYDVPVQFVEILGTYQRDRRYFAGGGDFVDADPSSWHVTSGNLQRFEDNLASRAVIAFPEYAARVKYNQQNGLGNNGYPANMNLETGCDLQTVMCCFTNDGTEDGFEMTDASITDVCRHDLRDSPQSNHVANGWSVFPGDESTPAHCVGFTWTDDNVDLVGNMMYDVSLRNTLTRGYKKGVPGAPMCGCIEHMPVVESASCRTATRTGPVTNVFTYRDGYVSASNEANIVYADCDGGLDLAGNYKSKIGGNAIDAHLVGENMCASDLSTYLMEEQFLIENSNPSRYVTADDTIWDQVIGMGTLFLPPQPNATLADADFRAQVTSCLTSSKDRHCIIRRICHSCTSPVHRDIYYKRITPLPPPGTNITNGEVYFLDMFMNRWASYMNVLNVDFELYGSYEDALSGTNKWQYCNYDYFSHPVGFPRDCSPYVYTGDQWNSYSGWMPFAQHHGYYVEKSV
ncbi:hypothetical protein ACHAXA_003427 [Cyclostephanos tholiformis]|uniref:Uncharacterized protein n=1 Tax=Cyclostephanos tholiformis TaxID=382380 RepID=A0ABD3SFG1_9STRA